TIDGVDFVFQMTPETEAPAEMCVYLPQFRALCMAELVNSHLHNLLPLRGAKARSAFMWAQYLQEALHLFGDGTDVMFITHHWPCWGTAAVKDLLEKQRDLYKYINDQTVRAIRHGQTMVEIAEDLALPESLNSEWCSRGYYGSLNHNVKATYQWYLGWYDGVPANLNPLPPEEGGRKYVEFMGGPEETLRKARESYEKGEYRWAVTVLNHLVFSGLGGAEAEALLADTYEQLGWQAECATWRNSYLQGAKELREGPAHLPQRTASSASLENLPTDAVLAFLATTLDPARAAGVRLAVNISLTDTGETWCALLANSVLSCWPAADEGAAATCPMTRRTLDRLAAGELDAGAALAEGQVLEQGEAGALQALFAVFEEAPATGFNIVTP
ncbi:MAG: alkyl sulfatase dimerization domain-containing protein, partial [Desulfovibrionaceae bacterium]|nr:alkyl sulfatase dimerization domain-containing protein [Desulfovibrionaceae bacterium]